MNISRKDLIIFIIIFFIFLFLLFLPALNNFHVENDEIIYMTLALNNTFHFKDYTLRDTSILKELASENYDFPVFHHPPLYVFILSIFYKIFSIKGFVLFSIISSFGIIWFSYLISKKMYGYKFGLISFLVMGSCPVLLFVSSKIWMDSFLVFLITVAFYYSMKISYEESIKNNLLNCFISGMFLFFAFYTKYPGILILVPIVINLILGLIIFPYLNKNDNKIDTLQKLIKEIQNNKKMFTHGSVNFLFYLIILLLPMILTIPWFYYNLQTLGIIIQTLKPSEHLQEMFPYAKLVVHRPWYFYFTQIFLINPLIVTLIFIFTKKDLILKNLSFLMWFFIYLISFTIFGMQGGGYQNRYIFPLFIPLNIMVSQFFYFNLKSLNLTINSKNSLKQLMILFLFCTFLVFNFITGLLNAYFVKTADLVPITRIIFR